MLFEEGSPATSRRVRLRWSIQVTTRPPVPTWKQYLTTRSCASAAELLKFTFGSVEVAAFAASRDHLWRLPREFREASRSRDMYARPPARAFGLCSRRSHTVRTPAIVATEDDRFGPSGTTESAADCTTGLLQACRSAAAALHRVVKCHCVFSRYLCRAWPIDALLETLRRRRSGSRGQISVRQHCRVPRPLLALHVLLGAALGRLRPPAQAQENHPRGCRRESTPPCSCVEAAGTGSRFPSQRCLCESRETMHRDMFHASNALRDSVCSIRVLARKLGPFAISLLGAGIVATRRTYRTAKGSGRGGHSATTYARAYRLVALRPCAVDERAVNARTPPVLRYTHSTRGCLIVCYSGRVGDG